MKQASKIFLPTAIIKIHVNSPGGIPSEHTMPLKVNNFNRMKYQVLCYDKIRFKSKNIIILFGYNRKKLCHD